MAASSLGVRWTVSTLAGSGAKGFADGARAAAQFYCPCALAPLPDGSVVVADSWNHCIRLIAAGGGAVSTLAGKGGELGIADGPAATARFNFPNGIVVGADGAIFVADSCNHSVRRIKDGAVTTFAGSGEMGGADGIGAAASFDGPYGLALGPGGVLYVTEHFISLVLNLVLFQPAAFYGNRVRMISPAGAVTTLAGCGDSGFADGRGAAARFNYPTGIAVDAAGVVFVADQWNNRIRRITNGVVDTLAGSGKATTTGSGPSIRTPAPSARSPAAGPMAPPTATRPRRASIGLAASRWTRGAASSWPTQKTTACAASRHLWRCTRQRRLRWP